MENSGDISYLMSLKYDTVVKKTKERFILIIPELALISEDGKLDNAYKKLESEKEKFFQYVVENDLQHTIIEPERQKKKIRNKSFRFTIIGVLLLILITLMGLKAMSLVNFYTSSHFITRKASQLTSEISVQMENLPEEAIEDLKMKFRKIAIRLKPMVYEFKNMFEDEDIDHKQIILQNTRTRQFSNAEIINMDDSTDYFEKAKNGDNESQYKLGLKYHLGIGIEPNEILALKWINKAADQGHALSQFYLGHHYSKSNSSEFDNMKAVEWFEKAVENGITDANFELGRLYYLGWGIKNDYVKAFKSFLKVAKSGKPSAQFNVGAMYHDGIGVERNYTEALHWYRKAAGVGYPWAQYEIGRMFQNGQGVIRSTYVAVDWYYKSGRSHLEMGNTEGALMAASAIDNLIPDHSFAKALLQEVYSEKN